MQDICTYAQNSDSQRWDGLEMMNSWQTGFLRTAAYFSITAISGMLGVVLLGHIDGDVTNKHKGHVSTNDI